jgi:peptidylprolyl isomerase
LAQFARYTKREKMNNELEITDVRLGDGKTVVKGALITTQYTGTLEDGTVFDSSWERGKPFQCVIGTGRVIKGWDQGLMGMKVGGIRTLFVPAHLAYGERSMGAHITPNSNLRFEIELLEVLTRDD